jgi:hypothetical protein
MTKHKSKSVSRLLSHRLWYCCVTIGYEFVDFLNWWEKIFYFFLKNLARHWGGQHEPIIENRPWEHDMDWNIDENQSIFVKTEENGLFSLFYLKSVGLILKFKIL